MTQDVLEDLAEELAAKGYDADHVSYVPAVRAALEALCRGGNPLNLSGVFVNVVVAGRDNARCHVMAGHAGPEGVEWAATTGYWRVKGKAAYPRAGWANVAHALSVMDRVLRQLDQLDKDRSHAD